LYPLGSGSQSGNPDGPPPPPSIDDPDNGGSGGGTYWGRSTGDQKSWI
jgi:hypothetical protein